jgi:hypothetical protein
VRTVVARIAFRGGCLSGPWIHVTVPAVQAPDHRKPTWNPVEIVHAAKLSGCSAAGAQGAINFLENHRIRASSGG